VGTLASAVVTGTGNMVGVVNESFFTVPGGQRQRQTTTAAFGLSQATAKMAAPLYKVNHDYKNSGLRVQNTDLANAAALDITFALGGSGGVPVTEYVLDCTVAAGQAVTLFKLYGGAPSGCAWVGDAIPTSWSSSSTSAERFGSVMVTADRAIVGVVTESDEDPVVDSRQDIKSYEAFNLE
jgi:hypothetical protein